MRRICLILVLFAVACGGATPTTIPTISVATPSPTVVRPASSPFSNRSATQTVSVKEKRTFFDDFSRADGPLGTASTGQIYSTIPNSDRG